MSYKRKGQLNKSPEWVKHLREIFHRQFWKINLPGRQSWRRTFWRRRVCWGM